MIGAMIRAAAGSTHYQPARALSAMLPAKCRATTATSPSRLLAPIVR
jgi:hypothetical protein